MSLQLIVKGKPVRERCDTCKQLQPVKSFYRFPATGRAICCECVNGKKIVRRKRA